MTDIVADTIAYDHGFRGKVTGEEWTEERIALLTELRAQKVKRSEIAYRINRATGSHFSKGAICGKIDRLFTAARPKRTPEEKAATLRAQRDRRNAKEFELRQQRREHRQQQRAALGLSSGTIGRKSTKVVPDQPSLRFVELAPKSITLLNLDESHCRYPYGDDVITFCGHPKMEGSSYCVPHYFLCRAPVITKGAAA